MSEGRVETLYAAVKARAAAFEIRPGERINEVALARELAASRTPLREALNRLVAERLIDFVPGQGFYCRALDVEGIGQLYELRRALEVLAIRLACERAGDDDLRNLAEEFGRDGENLRGKTVGELTARDEAFHLAIAELSRNDELVHQIRLMNERIRFIRWVDMGNRTRQTKGEHREMIDALSRRDANLAASVMDRHIIGRTDQIRDAVRQGYSNLFVDGPAALAGRLVDTD
ncbi:MAG: GntR family transcriptional regulator [Rhodobacteraceae bacterium]|nr:GntR family transcriptional regulator [Paracoccaceae bacterium]